MALRLEDSFWIDVRREVLPDEIDGGFCGAWARHASGRLSGRGIEHKIMRYEGKALMPTTDHIWIAIPDYKGGQMIIADGTAGQFFDKKYELGFYGPLHLADKKLKPVYSNGKIISLDKLV